MYNKLGGKRNDKFYDKSYDKLCESCTTSSNPRTRTRRLINKQTPTHLPTYAAADVAPPFGAATVQPDTGTNSSASP
ncbi:hypothetical protein GWI33_019478 [Rhynchophorus ferrugineus]|uniref:Uncharacterized protein n=1 Tax=Rhynchophorus ferrugineus TaxID=354439 RepID=A0A834HUB6_RHYFE|nr:hypothetical protein GWI33_019478 [Rhynchophorus ferrugineus]